MHRVIALLTDYGLSDPYVGMLKAVITSINPQAIIVDITHEIPKFNVGYGAFILRSAYKFFRKGTIFVAIVDPEVGTPRKGVVVISRNYVFVGPNNGILSPAAADDGIVNVYEVVIEKVRINEVSATFHGRDVFAPTAALLSLGVEPSSICRPLSRDEFVEISVPPHKPRRKDDYVEVSAYYVDHFGNVMLDADLSDILNELKVRLGDEVVVKVHDRIFKARISRTFAEVCEGCLALYRNSLGLAELGVFKGSAHDILGIRAGDKVCIGRA